MFREVDQKQVDQLVKDIFRAKTIVAVGAGRVGMSTRGFVMRLGHMQFRAYMIGDSTVPSIGKNDLFIAASGSGETQTVYDLAVIAKKSGARLAVVTANPHSVLGRLADTLVQIKAPSKTKAVDGFASIQPMTTLNEQCLAIFYDAVVLEMMKKRKESHDTMWVRHSNLE